MLQILHFLFLARRRQEAMSTRDGEPRQDNSSSDSDNDDDSNDNSSDGKEANKENTGGRGSAGEQREPFKSVQQDNRRYTLQSTVCINK